VARATTRPARVRAPRCGKARVRPEEPAQPGEEDLIQKLLVANRGEIALRVFRACRELGIATVAVVAPDDKGSLHGRSADETVEIASYLFSEEHIRAAKQARADAIHPGYGFLAENPDFAEAVGAAELTWVGPSPEALRAGGDKLEAKRIAIEAGVPIVPSGEPDDIGFPLVVKAAAGGGGRGMRVVRARDELGEALDAARREAKAAFGDARVFCERYVERPRHVEIQLLGDTHGKVLALGERDCSVQRRHQKVLEEAPSPAVDAALRREMSEAALRFAQAIDYQGAGTVEFMLDGREFFFLELNGRIQVEHPVTELVARVDLVQSQVRIASGEKLDASFSQDGHAVEVRLYAEDPRTFFPQTGRISKLRLPHEIRVDAGVEEGDEIGIAYDPMIAKLIAHGKTREEALDRLQAALSETEVEGVTTNLPFLRWLVSHPVVRAGDTTTAFLTEQSPLSQRPLRAPDPPWRGPFRLNLRAPSPAPAPDVDAAVAEQHGATGGQSTVTAPMPGTVIKVLVAAGESVQPRQPLVVLEAMKMETPLSSPYQAVVRAVHVAEGDQVAGGTVLVELEE
jgi:acetyl/propionyl-CoA carboxylase alpha subunit